MNGIRKTQTLQPRPKKARVVQTRSWQIPEWEPKPVATLKGWSIEEGLTPALRLRHKRLTTDIKMKFVWCSLERELNTLYETKGKHHIHPNNIADAVASFLRGYLYQAIVGDTATAYWQSVPGMPEQGSKMRKILKHAQELIELLALPAPHEKQWSPWNRLTTALDSESRLPPSDRAHLKHLAMQTYGRHWSDEASVSGKPPIEMHGSNFAPFPINHAPALLGDLLPQLQGLVLLSNASISDFMETKIKPPNKTKSLERNAYVLNLARRVKIFGLAARQQASRGPGFHLNQILAITANVSLALEGPDELKADTVRKLIADNH